MKSGALAGLGAIVAIIIGFWLLVVVLKVAFKLIGLAVIVGLAAIVYFAVKNRIGGGDAR